MIEICIEDEDNIGDIDKVTPYLTEYQMPLEDWFVEYCNTIGVLRTNSRFICGGYVLNGSETPEELLRNYLFDDEDNIHIKYQLATVQLTFKHAINEKMISYTRDADYDGILREVMLYHSKLVQIDKKELRFLYSGRRLQPTDTPKALGMGQACEVDVFLAQVTITLNFIPVNFNGAIAQAYTHSKFVKFTKWIQIYHSDGNKPPVNLLKFYYNGEQLNEEYSIGIRFGDITNDEIIYVVCD